MDDFLISPLNSVNIKKKLKTQLSANLLAYLAFTTGEHCCVSHRTELSKDSVKVFASRSICLFQVSTIPFLFCCCLWNSVFVQEENKKISEMFAEVLMRKSAAGDTPQGEYSRVFQNAAHISQSLYTKHFHLHYSYISDSDTVICVVQHPLNCVYFKKGKMCPGRDALWAVSVSLSCQTWAGRDNCISCPMLGAYWMTAADRINKYINKWHFTRVISKKSRLVKHKMHYMCTK